MPTEQANVRRDVGAEFEDLAQFLIAVGLTPSANQQKDVQ